MPCEFPYLLPDILSAANIIPTFPLWKFKLPWSQTANGSLSGASAESSMEAPKVNDPAAMITLLSYPGMSQGSGSTKESMGALD